MKKSKKICKIRAVRIISGSGGVAETPQRSEELQQAPDPRMRGSPSLKKQHTFLFAYTSKKVYSELTMKKSIISLFFVLMVLPLAFAGGKKDKAAEVPVQESPAISESAPAEEAVKEALVVHSAVLNGPTGIPSAYFFENKPDLGGAELEIEVLNGANLELPKLLKGEVQIGVLPVNIAAKAFNSSKAVTALAVIGYGNVYLITTDSNYKSLADLKGKSVAVAGQGATPDYMFQYILDKNGLKAGEDADCVKLDYSTPNAELAAAVISGKFQYAVVPEPFATVATTKTASVKRALNLSDEYGKFNNGKNYPLSLLVANAKFASENKDVVNAYIDAYAQAVEWTNANPNKAGVLVQKNTLGLMAPVAAKAIPNCAFVCQEIAGERQSIEDFLNIYLSFAPQAIGGKLPSDEFYYSR